MSLPDFPHPPLALGGGVLLIALAAQSGPVQGQERADNANGLSFSLGLGARYEADYEGSDDYQTNAVPLFRLSWNDRITLSTLEGPALTLKAYEGNGFRADIGIGYDFGRAEDDNDVLKGLGDVDGTPTLLTKLEYATEMSAGELSFGLDVERDLGGNRKGTQLGLSAAYGMMAFGGRGSVQFGIDASWADKNYMSTMFGITQNQATNADLAMTPHDAKAGWKDIGVSLTSTYDLSDNLMLVGQASYTKLLADAADSPLVADYGSENQTAVTLGVLYSW